MFHLEPHDAKVNRHKAMKTTLIIFIAVAVALLVLLDWCFVSIIISRGGFEAWMDYNPFWSLAIGYLVGFHVVAGLILWACTKD